MLLANKQYLSENKTSRSCSSTISSTASRVAPAYTKDELKMTE